MVNDLIKFTFDIFAHVIPGIIILAAFSLLTVSFKPQPVIEVKEKAEAKTEVPAENSKKTTKPKEAVDYGMIAELLKNLEGTGKGVVVIILAYLVGFAINPFGKRLYRMVGPKLWPKIYVENDIKGMHISDKFILIREYSPTNFQYVERWNMYSSLSHNLAVGCLVFIVVSIMKLFLDKGHIVNWIIILIVSLILFFTFIKSALVYNQWAGRDLNSAISALKLREKNQS